MKTTILFVSIFSILRLEAQNNVSYINLYDDPTFNAKAINTTLEIGVTPGGEGVGPTGAAMYSIPLGVPNGTNGMAPKIALVYNSQNGNGLAGYGWDISGLSIISRTPKTIYHDGKVEPVQVNNTDVYSLDGNRLVAVSGTYGSNNTKYRTELETFVQVTSFINSGTIIDWFKVETKEGTTLEYGNTSDAKILAAGTSAPIAWRLNKVTDNFGNYMLFKYKNVGSENVIDEILYTGNLAASLNPFCSIKFVYENRQDKNFIFVTGTRFENNLLLSKVIINIDGANQYKRYELRYGFDKYSFLSEVQEFGSDNKGINSTIFKYGDKTVPVDKFWESVLRGVSSDVIPGDFNGDGYTDFVSADYAYHPNNAMKYHTGYSLYLNNLGSYTLAGSPQYFPPFLYEIDETKSKLSISNMLSLFNSDFNGDGKEDLAVPVKTYNNGFTKLEKTILYYSTGTGFATYDIPSPTTNKFIYPGSSSYFIPGDFDGDGSTDFISFLSDGGSYKTYIVYPRIGTTNFLIYGQSSFLADANDLMVVDFNGDGKNDLMYIKDGNCKIYSFEKSGSQVNATILYNVGYPTKWHKIFSGDFNGDGKTDFLTSGNNNSWEIGFSTGSSSSGFNIESIPYGLNVFNQRIKIGDYDGDGKSDIFVAKYTGSSSYNITIYYRVSNGFTPVSHDFSGVLYAGYYPNTNYKNIGFISLDINGDGKTDEIMKTHFQEPLDEFVFNKYSKEFYLEKIKNGHGQVITFNYSPLSRGFLYIKGNTSVYPVIDFQQPIQVVIKTSKSDGIGGISNINYTYEEALLHRQGKGFLGFKKIITTDHAFNKEVVEENELNTTFFSLALKKQKLFRKDNTSLISETTNTNNFNGLGGKRYFRFVSQSATSNLLQGYTVTKNFSYDPNGNLTKLTENRGGIENSEISNQFTTAGAWLPSRTSSTTIKNTRTGQSVYSRTINYEYDNRGALLKEKKDFGLPQMVTTQYITNALGNVTNISILSSGLPTVNTSYIFDNKGRYPIKSTNPLSQTEEITYHPVFSLPVLEKGIDGLSTTYEYDGFGRLKKIINPLGVESVTSLGWKLPTDAQSALAKAIYFSKTANQGRPDSKIWYDMYNREVFSETEGLTQNIFIQKKYDNRGNILMQTSPHYQYGQIVWTNYQYDNYNRLTKANIDNLSTTYSYNFSNGLSTTTTTTSTNQVNIQISDPTGKIVSSTDNGGTLNYEYYSSGKHKKVTLNGLEISSMEYDIYANQTKLNDKNSGITTYEHNAYGQLTKQVDANGNQYLMQYDVMGRLINKNGAGGITTYQYIQSGNGLNRLSKVIGPNNTMQEYVYDINGRLSLERETIGSDVFPTLYQYDNFDNIIFQRYPSGFRIRRNYDSNGFLVSVHQDGNSTLIYSNPEMNALGQYTKYKQNGIETTKKYTDYGFLTRIYQFSGPNIQNMQYGFDPATGNLNFIKDIKKGLEETYVYDNLNRLISSKVVGSPNILLTYAQNGNINSKSDLGQYTYDPVKVNAVTKVQNSNILFTPMVQNVTYTSFNKTATVSQDQNLLDITYGPDQERKKSVLKNNGNIISTKYFLSDYEKIIEGNNTAEVHYISCGDGLKALYVIENGVGSFYSVFTDYLGSINTIVNSSQNIVAEQNFDAWGRFRNTSNWKYSNVQSVPFWLHRGYTGHEHLKQFGLVNMNGRLYEPIVGRMLSVDNYVQNPLFSQNYNRYSYAFNNPLVYSDPSGEIVWAAVAIGAAFGGFSGYQIAHSKGYGFNDSQTYGYILGGMAIGGISGGIGAEVAATSSLLMSNTLGIASASYINSIGMSALSGGGLRPSISFGLGSYDFYSSEVKSIFDWNDLSTMEKIGYSFGSLTVLQDVFAWNQGTKIDALARKDFAGHSEIRGLDGKITISVSPKISTSTKHGSQLNWESYYLNHADIAKNTRLISDADLVSKTFSTRLNNINGKMLSNMTNNLNSGKTLLGGGVFKYSVGRGCVNYTSRALLYSGVPTVNAFLPITSPVFLNFELAARQMGIYASPFLTTGR